MHWGRRDWAHGFVVEKMSVQRQPAHHSISGIPILLLFGPVFWGQLCWVTKHPHGSQLCSLCMYLSTVNSSTLTVLRFCRSCTHQGTAHNLAQCPAEWSQRWGEMELRRLQDFFGNFFPVQYIFLSPTAAPLFPNICSRHQRLQKSMLIRTLRMLFVCLFLWKMLPLPNKNDDKSLHLLGIANQY